MWFFKKKTVIGSLIAIATLVLILGGVWASGIWNKVNHNQMALFEQTLAPIETPEPIDSGADSLSADSTEATAETASVAIAPTPTPTLSPYDLLVSQADQSIMKDTLNVLLIGVDYAQERVNNPKEYGPNFNSDVMIVLAINFKQNKVDMISVPRDSYAKIANLTGIYKLNYALTAGGGMNDKGYMNVCKSVQGVLGGIPVNYYIAVSMPVVKELTDAVGGVDFDMDIDYSIDGRSYQKGMQHLAGQGVLDYCRIRKGDIISSEAGDLNRVNRQKKMLLAVFKKIQGNSKILDVPKLLLSMQGKVFTNTNFEQLAAIAVFGKGLPEANITMRTIPGSYINSIFKLNYVILDQSKRVQLIKDVYGIAVPPQYKYSAGNARLLWAYMQGQAWVKAIRNVLAKDAKLPAEKQKLTDTAQNQQLADALNSTQAKLNQYKKKANGTGYVKIAEAQDLEKQVEGLYNLANSMFSKAGYKANWNISVTTRGEPAMK